MTRNRFYVEDDDGWVVRDRRDGLNVFGRGWRWNSRSVARAVRDEYEQSICEPDGEALLERSKHQGGGRG